MSDRTELNSTIKKLSENLGISLIGFAPIERWAEFEETEKEFYPKNIWDWSKTVISIGIPVFLPVIESTPSNAYSELYNTTNRLLDDFAYKIAAFLNGKGFRAVSAPRDGYGEIMDLVREPNSFLSQVLAAKYAGLGTIGYNHALITPQFGPRVRFACIVTDADIEPSKLFEKDLCSGCLLCVKNCPTGAFSPSRNSKIGIMDKYRCARYHQFLREEHRYPCGVCVMSCPAGHDKKIYDKQLTQEAKEHIQDYGSKNDLDNFKIKQRRFIMSKENYKFETLQVHAGQENPDSA
ncbi:MAG: 4Fe-4S binding protein, partial [Endomicrobium sp.]|nr:4Fe-4S binding protein [Endomicrobium sp.]